MCCMPTTSYQEEWLGCAPVGCVVCMVCQALGWQARTWSRRGGQHQEHAANASQHCGHAALPGACRCQACTDALCLPPSRQVALQQHLEALPTYHPEVPAADTISGLATCSVSLSGNPDMAALIA